MSGDDSGLLVVSSSVSSQLEDLSGQVLEDSGEVDGSSGSDLGKGEETRKGRVSVGEGEGREEEGEGTRR